MRLPILLSTLLPALAMSHVAVARELPTEVFLTTGSDRHEIAGRTVHGSTSLFVFRSPSARNITFKLDAENGPCGFELQRSSELGYQRDFGRFPTSTTQRAKEGETFTLSFYQSRSAWMEKAACSFSLSVQ